MWIKTHRYARVKSYRRMVLNESAERMLTHGTGKVVMFGTRRDSVEITSDILRTARSGVTKTRIATKSYLKFQIGCSYIDRPIDLGLLERTRTSVGNQQKIRAKLDIPHLPI